MSGKAWGIYKALANLVKCCEEIEESELSCGTCPMSHNCIKDATLYDFVEFASYDTLHEALETAHEVSSRQSAEDAEAEEANVRRCDPDWD